MVNGIRTNRWVKNSNGIRWRSAPVRPITTRHLGWEHVQKAPTVPPVCVFSVPIKWLQSGRSVLADAAPEKLGIGRSTGRPGAQMPVRW